MHPLFIHKAKYNKVLRCVALRCISINSTRAWVVYIFVNIIRSTSSNHILMYVIRIAPFQWHCQWGLCPTDTASEAGQVSGKSGCRLDVIICGNHPRGCLTGRLPVHSLLVYQVYAGFTEELYSPFGTPIWLIH